MPWSGRGVQVAGGGEGQGICGDRLQGISCDSEVGQNWYFRYYTGRVIVDYDGRTSSDRASACCIVFSSFFKSAYRRPPCNRPVSVFLPVGNPQKGGLSNALDEAETRLWYMPEIYHGVGPVVCILPI